MGFHNILFPIKMARGAIGGPIRNTQIFSRANGAETRNIVSNSSRRKWNIASSGAKLDDLQELIAFFEARFGKTYAFRFFDPIDNKSCLASNEISALDQIIGHGDAINKQFQLVKNYGDGANNYQRKIQLPVLNSVKIAINDQLIAASNYVINYQTGIVDFINPPPNQAIIKAGFAFDCKVRFDIDFLELSLESANTGRINDIELLEVL